MERGRRLRDQHSRPGIGLLPKCRNGGQNGSDGKVTHVNSVRL